MKHNGVWAVISAYNEEKNISSVINKSKKYANVIVVDDGSADGTFDIAKKAGVFALKHIVNMGKGAALKTGCDFAVQKNAKVIIALDADGQHNPEDIPRFLKTLKNKDIVFGYRGFSKNMPLMFKFGNWVINKTLHLLYGIDLKDTQSGFRAFKSSAYKKIRWVSLDYSVESEMITNVGKNKLKYAEIPIKTVYSDKYKGTSPINGIKIVLNIIWWKIASLFGGKK